MKKWIFLLILLAAAGAAVLLWPTANPNQAIPGGGQATPQGDAPKADPAAPNRARPVAAPRAPDILAEDDDPEGDLRLEGQVIDGQDLPVAGATVVISAKPERVARTDEGGSFTFDKLIAKRYMLTARKDVHVAGPVVYRLTPKSDPIILRMRLGAMLDVTVTDSAGGQPVVGGYVELRGEQGQPAVTDAGGKARLTGVAGGYKTVAAWAEGFAPAHRVLIVPDASPAPIEVKIALRPGAPASGRVIDVDGQPISGARVLAMDTATLIQSAEFERDGALTDEAGQFRLAALAAGTYRFSASHDDHPQSDSKAISTDGKQPLTGIEITMRQGGRVSGRVVTSAGQPSPFASVRITTKSGAPLAGGLGGARQRGATADDQGAFTFGGLPREKMLILAIGENASSEAVAVDLDQRDAITDLELVLAVDGRISGQVVDASGQPVAEVDVTARPDIWAEGLKDSTRLRGQSQAITDGGGRFALTGLAEGAYRLRAARSSGSLKRFMQTGVQARTGDENVQLVLEAEGSLQGQVQFADGGSPAQFSVAVSFPPGVPVSSPDGRFDLPEIAPGTYQVTIRGSEFADATIADVEVKPDQRTDLGLIQVRRGRTVTGMVRTQDGAPVSEATVVVARRLVGDGSSLTLDLGAGAEESMGLRRTLTDHDGAFRLGGLGAEKFVIVADHEQLGRSLPQTIPASGPGPALDLVLQGFGKVSGQVTSGGKPLKGAVVTANIRGEASQTVIVHAAEDGSYQIARLPAGEHRIGAALQSASGIGGKSNSIMVTVRAGEEVRADIDIPTGHVTLTVNVQPLAEAVISAAQVLLLKGQVTATTGGELNKVATSSGGGITASFWLPGKPCTFKELVPGEYSLCAVPISGNMNDPAFMQRLQKNSATLRVVCSPLVIASSPAEQAHTIAIPAMDPLPEEPAAVE